MNRHTCRKTIHTSNKNTFLKILVKYYQAKDQKLSKVVHNCNPSIQGAEAKGSESKARLGCRVSSRSYYMRPSPQKKNTKERKVQILGWEGDVELSGRARCN